MAGSPMVIAGTRSKDRPDPTTRSFVRALRTTPAQAPTATYLSVDLALRIVNVSGESHAPAGLLPAEVRSRHRPSHLRGPSASMHRPCRLRLFGASSAAAVGGISDLFSKSDEEC